jgi:THO complex subunit 1
MKRSIAEYLKQGFEGAFFYRMVETVLSRDKNWARWKIENCPSIARPAVSPEDYVGAKGSAIKATTSKRIRPTPLGSLDLKFLSGGDDRSGLNRLKDRSRYQLPSIKSFKSKIELDDMDIDMARDEESKNIAIESKASKSWRALRIASTSKLVAFDKIERSDKIDNIFQDDVKPEEVTINRDDETQDGEDLEFPKDRRPIVISGPSGVGKGALVNMLLDKHPKVFGKKVSHTTRPPREGEIHGKHYYFVSKEEFDVLLDGDGFLEYNNYNGDDYGTSKKVLEGIISQGKVPIMEMDMHVSSIIPASFCVNAHTSKGVQQLKEQGYAARFIFIAPPDMNQLEQRLRQRGSDSDDKIQDRLEIANKEIEHAGLDGFYDTTIVNDDLETAYKELENYIFGIDESNEPSGSNPAHKLQESVEGGNTDVEMTSGDGDALGQVVTRSKEVSGPPGATETALDDKD